MELIFATNNQHKIDEIASVMPSQFKIKTLHDAGIYIDIPEPFNTLEENAAEKANTIYKITGVNCFSEDTGLEVYSLNNEPGVKSARYAGNSRSFKNNTDKLLSNLYSKERKARFRTVICLIVEDKQYFFEGICEGEITNEEKGTNGFGYDSVFKPIDSQKTFGEMALQEKNQFSHRKKAIDKLVTFLNTIKDK